jgi:hypothetical protein
MQTFTEKLIFHMPKKCRTGCGLEDIDLEPFLSSLEAILDELGIPGCYYTESTGHFYGCRFEQLLITVCCTEIQADKLTERYLDLLGTFKNRLCQDSFAIERSGKLTVIESGELS